MKRLGFSLIEVIVTMGITVIIFLLLSMAVNAVLTTTRYRTGQAQQIQQATQVLDYAVHTIRETQTSPTGAFPIIDATSSSLTIYTTISGTSVAQVRFFMNGPSLQQGVILPVGDPATYPTGNEVISTILSNVRSSASPLFTYFTDAYTGTQAAMNPIDVPNIRLVHLELQFDPDTHNRPSYMTIALNAELRNLKDNY